MKLSNLKIEELLVADTGPILALARIDFLKLLCQLFRRVEITYTVLQECVIQAERADARAVVDALYKGWLFEIPDPQVRAALGSLDPGEQSTLEHALRKQATVLLDDKKGRQWAKLNHVRVIGTLGIILLAKKNGFIAAVKPEIVALVGSGYFLSDSLIADALALAGEG